MVASQRRTFDPQFKVQVVFELLRGEKTMAQLCREHNLGADLVSHWRHVLLERAAQVFAERSSGTGPEAARIAELERLVGQQALELALLKKAAAWPRVHPKSNGS